MLRQVRGKRTYSQMALGASQEADAIQSIDDSQRLKVDRFTSLPAPVINQICSHLPTINDMLNLRFAMGARFFKEASASQQTRFQSVADELTRRQPQTIKFSSYNLYMLTKDGIVYSSGGNDYGQLGYPGLRRSAISMPIWFGLDKDDKVLQLEVGDEFAGVLTSKGNVYTWGHNGHGQLGIVTNHSYIPSPCLLSFNLAENEVIIKIAFGAAHGMALSNFGRVYIWGDRNNTYGPFDDLEPVGVDFEGQTIRAAVIPDLAVDEVVTDIKAGSIDHEK